MATYGYARVSTTDQDLSIQIAALRAAGCTVIREETKSGSSRRGRTELDTSTAAGKAFLDMLGVFAEFETNLRRERQLEGIAKAKAAGVYRGRKPSIDAGRVRALREGGLGPAAIARRLGIGRASVYRLLG
jgi:DNA invertase Pin-like site-specific DNA recombinase